ncbi:MAG: hypothetical protein LBM87_01635 [Ruminococcus sp.]|jgi:type III secretory pathway component EscS|nr:hypothetical protein [Ruminococcus sp.]
MGAFRIAAGAACFIGIVISIVDSLSPSQKFTKQLKIMFALIFILCVITPLANGSINFTEIAAPAIAQANSAEISGLNGEEYYIRSIINNINRNLKEELKANYINAVNLETSINISETGSISISVIDCTLSDPSQAEEALNVLSGASGGLAQINIYDGSGI